MGGDDYITKPFNALEVVARIKVQLKRWQMCLSQGRPKTLEFADFGINTESCEVIRNGQPLEMTALEYSLLLFLPSIRTGFLPRPNYMKTYGDS